MKKICKHCKMPIAIRNPSGYCDHLYYPDNCPICKADKEKVRMAKIQNQIKDYFEKVVLRNTCFNSLEELMEDATLVDVNAPRALIACELKGVWRGFNIARLTKEIFE